MNFAKLIEISRALYPRYSTGRQFHTTFFLKKNRIVSMGYNNYYKSHPINLRHNYKDRDGNDCRYHVGLHSEIACFLRYGQEDTSDLVWINIRIGRNGLVGLSKFCQGCQSLLRQSGFKRAFYSTNSDNFEEFALAD